MAPMVTTASPLSSSEAVARLRRGDADALGEVTRRFGTLVTAAARRVLGTAPEVDDVVQETWMALLANAGTIREPQFLGSWLWTTATNLARRSARMSARTVVTDPAALPDPSTSQADVSDQVELGDLCTIVHRVVGGLPAPDRQLVELLFGGAELPYADVAVLVNRPVGSLGPTRRRLLTRLARDPAIGAMA